MADRTCGLGLGRQFGATRIVRSCCNDLRTTIREVKPYSGRLGFYRFSFLYLSQRFLALWRVLSGELAIVAKSLVPLNQIACAVAQLFAALPSLEPAEEVLVGILPGIVDFAVQHAEVERL
jgi:hypothetical protein